MNDIERAEKLDSLLERNSSALTQAEDSNEIYRRVAAIGDIIALALRRRIPIDAGTSDSAASVAIQLASPNREINEKLQKN